MHPLLRDASPVTAQHEQTIRPRELSATLEVRDLLVALCAACCLQILAAGTSVALRYSSSSRERDRRTVKVSNVPEPSAIAVTKSALVNRQPAVISVPALSFIARSSEIVHEE